MSYNIHAVGVTATPAVLAHIQRAENIHNRDITNVGHILERTFSDWLLLHRGHTSLHGTPLDLDRSSGILYRSHKIAPGCYVFHLKTARGGLTPNSFCELDLVFLYCYEVFECLMRHYCTTGFGYKLQKCDLHLLNDDVADRWRRIAWVDPRDPTQTGFHFHSHEEYMTKNHIIR